MFILQDGVTPSFEKIVAMHSELVCLGNDGKLYQWKWSEPEPYKSVDETGSTFHHPRTKSLSLTNESVAKLSGCSARASVVTLSGKVSLVSR